LNAFLKLGKRFSQNKYRYRNSKINNNKENIYIKPHIPGIHSPLIQPKNDNCDATFQVRLKSPTSRQQGVCKILIHLEGNNNNKKNPSK